MPDDGHMAETYSMIMCRWVFDNKCTVLVFRLSPCCSNGKLSSGYFPGVWVLKTDVSELCVCSIFQPHHLLKMELTQSSETSAFNTQTPGKYPEDNLPSIQLY
jgi:hypothetical protein